MRLFMNIANYNYYEYLSDRLSKLERKLFEAKQVGTLYHVCSVEAARNYIFPEDQLKGSGRYTANKITGTKDVIYFSRNKRIDNVAFLTRSHMIIQFVVDGDKLSERYHIFPYNDFIDDERTGYSGSNSLRPTKTPLNQLINNRQQEECVLGTIKNFSSYVTKINMYYDKTIKLSGASTKRYYDKDEAEEVVDEVNKFCKSHGIELNLANNLKALLKIPFEVKRNTSASNSNSNSNSDSKKKAVRKSMSKTELDSEFWRAAYTSDIDRMKELLAAGANVNYGEYNRTYLHQLSFFKKLSDDDLKVAQFLIDSGCNVNQQDINGCTALLNGVNNIPFATMLIKAGADPNIADNKGNTPLSKCKKAGIKKLLIAAGATE